MTHYYDDKWADKPKAEPMTKKRVLELIEQAKWDKYVGKMIKRIIDKYNVENPYDRIEYVTKDGAT